MLIWGQFGYRTGPESHFSKNIFLFWQIVLFPVLCKISYTKLMYFFRYSSGYMKGNESYNSFYRSDRGEQYFLFLLDNSCASGR